MKKRSEFDPGRDNRHLVSARVPEHESSSGREKLGQIRTIEQLLRRGRRPRADVLGSEWRVGQDNVETEPVPGHLADGSESVLNSDLVSFEGKFETGDILADHARVP